MQWLTISALCDGQFAHILQAALGVAVLAAIGAAAVLAAIGAAAALVMALAARVFPALLGTTTHDDDHDPLPRVRAWCDDRLTDPLLRAELLAVLDDVAAAEGGT